MIAKLVGSEQIGDEMEFDMAVLTEVVVKLDELGELGEEFVAPCLEITFIEELDGGGNDIEDVLAGGFAFGELGS